MLSKIKGNWSADMKKNKEPVYGQKWGGNDVLSQLTKALDKEITGSVAEIGCGGGRLTKWLFEMGAEKVTAFDVHERSVQRTRAYEPRANVFLSDGESIPGEKGQYDIVFSWAVLLHLPTYLAQWYIMEAYRVADKLIFALPSFEHPVGKKSYEVFIKNKVWRNTFYTGYFEHYTEDHIIKMCEFAGWKVKSTQVIRGREILCICEK